MMETITEAQHAKANTTSNTNAKTNLSRGNPSTGQAIDFHKQFSSFYGLTEKASKIFDIVFGLLAAQALHVAHELSLFEIINENHALSLEEIAKRLKIENRPAQALLSMCASLDLVSLNHQS